MKLRVAAVGRRLWHDDIQEVDFWDSVSFADFDVVVVDPLGLVEDLGLHPKLSIEGVNAVFLRRSRETRDLLCRRGGVVVIYLRSWPEPMRGLPSFYAWLPGLAETGLGREDLPGQPDLADLLSLREGMGTDVRLVQSCDHPFAGYVKAFRGQLRFDCEPEVELPESWTTFAVTGARRPAGFGAPLLGGAVVFIPPNTANDPRKEGGVVLGCLQRMRGSIEADPPPDWARAVPVPGQEQIEEEEAELETKQMRLDECRAKVSERRRQLDLFRMLLYATGTVQLEEAVRHALSLLGFQVADDGDGEADIYAEAPEGLIVGEVEGTNGQMEIGKLRQLLDYQVGCMSASESRKGFLFGNGYRREPPEKRGEQFTDAVVSSGGRYGFGLVPTSELFTAVCYVLQLGDEAARSARTAIRRSLFEGVGVWEFRHPH